MRAVRYCGLAAVVICALGAAAQAPVTLVPRYTSGETLLYSVSIHSSIGSGNTLDTSAEAEVRILPGAAPGRFTASMRFTSFSTKVQAQAASDLATLQKQSTATDHAAVSMTPAQFAVNPDSFKVVARESGAEYDQPVEMLEEIVRTDALPTGPSAVGAVWTRTRKRAIPTLNFSVSLRLDCSLNAIAPYDGQPAATIMVHAQGSTPLPPGSLPGSDALAAKGLLTEATVKFDTNATSHYRVADAVLLDATSSSHNDMHISLVGPSPGAQSSDTSIESTSTVKLEKEVPPANRR